MGSVSETGYGVVTFNVLKELDMLGHEVFLFRRGDRESGIVRACSQKADFFDYEAPCLQIWHQFDLAMSVGRGKYAAYPFFELDTFNDKEKHHLNYPDMVLAPSQWAKDVMLRNGVQSEETIDVVQPGVDLHVFNRVEQPRQENSPTTFLNAGKWEVRKGHDVIVEMFNKAFSPQDNVRLILMPTNVFLQDHEARNWEHLYMNSPLGREGKISIIPWLPSHEMVAQVMRTTDCGLFPSRGEGWNLELLEMMSLGKPVIATNYSAHTEFCTEENSMLIDVDGVEPAYDGKWFFEQGNWGLLEEKQMEQAIEHMRFVHKEVQEDGAIINWNGIQTAQKFTWENTAHKIEEVLLTSDVPVLK